MFLALLNKITDSIAIFQIIKHLNHNIFSPNSRYLTKSQPGTEETLAEAFDTLIQKKGFFPVKGQPHWFLSGKGGMAVALSYKDGYVYLHCSYSHYYDIERVSRTEQIAVPSEMSYHDDNYKFEL